MGGENIQFYIGQRLQIISPQDPAVVNPDSVADSQSEQ